MFTFGTVVFLDSNVERLYLITNRSESRVDE